VKFVKVQNGGSGLWEGQGKGKNKKPKKKKKKNDLG